MRQIESAKIRDAWIRAAADLGIDVIAPFTIETGDGRYTFVGLVKNFGRVKGTLIGTPDDEKIMSEIAIRYDYYYSMLFESYETYQKQYFIDTLDDWQWFGADDKKPEWYTGKPWS